MLNRKSGPVISASVIQCYYVCTGIICDKRAGDLIIYFQHIIAGSKSRQVDRCRTDLTIENNSLPFLIAIIAGTAAREVTCRTIFKERNIEARECARCTALKVYAVIHSRITNIIGGGSIFKRSYLRTAQYQVTRVLSENAEVGIMKYVYRRPDLISRGSGSIEKIALAAIRYPDCRSINSYWLGRSIAAYQYTQDTGQIG